MNVYKSVSKSVQRSLQRSLRVPASMGGGAAASAFDDIWGWWRADTKSGTTPNVVLTDLSGNSRDMTQQAGALTAGTSANGQAKLTGGSTAYLTSAATLESWPITIVAYGQRTSTIRHGFFGHTGASGFNTLWTGYDSASNDQYILNTNGAANNNTATDGVWVTRIGWGSRHAIINGISQSVNTLASIARSAAITTSLGTQYRGLNYDFQETLVWNRLLSFEELDEVYTYLNLRYSASIPLQSSYTLSPTIMLIGDSNAAGRGDKGASNVNIPAEYLGPISNANVLHGVAASNTSSPTGFETLDNIAAKTGFTGNHMLADNPSRPPLYVGCESAMCKEYLDLHGGSVWLVKTGVGGSFLYPTTPFWHPTDGGLVQNSINRVFGVNGFNWWKSVALLNAAGRRPDLKGIVISLGGNDASDVSGVAAAAYEANLTNFFTYLRSEIGFPDAKIFMLRWHSGSIEPFTSEIRTGCNAAVAATTNCQLVDMDGYELRGGGDTAHFSYNGQHALGQYLATQL